MDSISTTYRNPLSLQANDIVSVGEGLFVGNLGGIVNGAIDAIPGLGGPNAQGAVDLVSAVVPRYGRTAGPNYTGDPLHNAVDVDSSSHDQEYERSSFRDQT